MLDEEAIKEPNGSDTKSVGNKSGNKEEGGIGRINGRATSRYLRQILLYFLVVLLTFYSTRKSKKTTT